MIANAPTMRDAVTLRKVTAGSAWEIVGTQPIRDGQNIEVAHAWIIRR